MRKMQTAQAVHPLLSKWWMRARPVKAEITTDGIGAAEELYCPLWAKPLDWLHAALFGSTKLLPVVPAATRKVEPVTMAINVDTSELLEALALLEQIAAAATGLNATLNEMRAASVQATE